MNRKFVIKIGIIAGLILLLLIPLGMISGVIGERSSYRFSAQQSIAESWTGAQKFLGPVLVVPYMEYHQRKEWDKEKKQYRLETYTVAKRIHLLPEHLKIAGEVGTEERSRGIYAVPVYDAKLRVTGHFINQKLIDLKKEAGTKIELKQPFLSVMITDIRGVVTQPQLRWDGRAVEFRSGSDFDTMPGGMHASLPVPGADVLARYDFDFAVELHGMERLEFAPTGKNTDVSMTADWPHPSFIGRYLPTERTVTDRAFSAHWQVSAFSSNMNQAVDALLSGNADDFASNTFGVSLINPVDVYQQTERAVKYAELFLLLTFVAFFLFEVMKGLRLHPMQYLLVGMALTVFYLLLISLTEHIPFAAAYLVAALACVGTIGIYLKAVLQSWRRALTFSGTLLLLYGMLYVILRSEDNALLMGSLLLFGVLALVMMVTRHLDWYRVAEQMAQQAILRPQTAERTDS